MFDPSLGRWITPDPIGYEGGDPNLYGFVGNNPGTFTDPSGLAPNQAGTTDPSHVLEAIKAKMKQGKTKGQILSEISSEHGTNKDRYFFTKKYGWVDIRHFARAGELTLDHTPFNVVAGGFVVEVAQWLTEWGDDYRSGFSPEDLPSNSAGADYGIYARLYNLDVAFEKWLVVVGGLSQNDPAANKSALPLTDPSEKGGKNRGPSNSTSKPEGVAQPAIIPTPSGLPRGARAGWDIIGP